MTTTKTAPMKSGSSSPQRASVRMANNLLAGLVQGALLVFLQISLAALIFSGDLAGYFGPGIGVMLIGALLSMLIATALSNFHTVVSAPQDVPATLLAIMAAGVASSAGVAGIETFATVVAVMATTSLLTGVLLWCFGQFNLGRFVRFLPYPVIGGFMAGTGWLLFLGGLSVLNNGVIDRQLLSPESLVQWGPALIFALVLLITSRRKDNPIMMPLLFVGALGLFAIIMALRAGGLTQGMQQAMDNGWLLGPLPDADLWKPVTINVIQNANWAQLAPASPTIITVFLISIVSLLLNVSGLEIINKKDVNLNRELKSVGLANIVGSVAGSAPSYHILSMSALNNRLGATGKLAGAVVVLVLLTTLVFGADMLAYTPRLIAAGFLLFLGLSFLTEWLYDGWFKLPFADYIMVLLILFVIATVGLLQGIFAGIFISIVLFVVAYTNTDVIRQTFTRNRYQSYIMRAPEIEKQLEHHGGGFYVMELQGFIFFGMAHQLLDRVKTELDHGTTPMNTLLLDFRLVTGLDSSASYSFSRIRQITSKAGVSLCFSNVDERIRQRLSANTTADSAQYFDDLDHAIASLDEQTLEQTSSIEFTETPITTLQYFQQALALDDSDRTVERLMRYMEHSEQLPGTVLLSEGEPVNRLFFIESGKVNIQTVLADGSMKLLRVQNGGTVFGEIGMYTQSTATASVVVAEPAQVYTLSQQSLTNMETEDSALAIAVHRLIASVLGRKLTQANYALVALQK